jgi:tyrosine-protein phosphatase SIW14
MIRTLAAVALGLLSLAAAPATRPAARPTTLPAVLPGEIQGIHNFARVSPILYRGAQPTAEGFAELKKMGVRTVVNLRSTGGDEDEMRGLGMRYVEIETLATGIDQKDVIRFLKVVSDPANQPVFVHCRRGADRTGCAVAAYRIVEQGWTPDDALAEMRRFSFNGLYFNIPRYLARIDVKDVRQRVGRARMPRVKVVD